MFGLKIKGALIKGGVPLLILLSTPCAWAVSTPVHTSANSTANAMSFEVMGRSIFFGVTYDRKFQNQWSVGVGISRTTTEHPSNTDIREPSWLVPVYFQYYLSPELRGWLVSAGVTWMTAGPVLEEMQALLAGMEFGSIPFYGHFGWGYEIREDSGFLLRLNGLGNISRKLTLSWGFCLGYLF